MVKRMVKVVVYRVQVRRHDIWGFERNIGLHLRGFALCSFGKVASVMDNHYRMLTAMMTGEKDAP